MSDDTHLVSISSNPSLTADDIARKQFPVVRRGVDGDAVRRYLESLARDVRDLLEREAALRRQLADAEQRAASPVLDEATLTQAVGAETARILQTAHDAARDVVSRAEESVADKLRQAEGVLAERTGEAEAAAAALLATAEGEGVEITEAARAEADSVAEAAEEEAAALLDTTKRQCQEVVRQARDLRNRVLSDLGDRRHALFVQLEQLRTGRDVLVEVIEAAGAAVDDVRARLAEAEHDARMAAAEAGERAEESDQGLDLSDLDETELELIGDLEEPELDEADVEEAAGEGSLADGEERTDEELMLELAVDEGLAAGLVEEAGAIEGGEAGDGEDGDDGGGAPRRNVDELFARIRASREAEVAEAEAELEEAELEEAELEEAELEKADVAAAVVAEVIEEEVAAEIALEEAAEEEVAAANELAAAAAAVDDEPEPEQLSAHQAAVSEPDDNPEDEEAGTHPELPLDADAAAIARRTEALAPLVTRVGRSLKRALQDDQNELLDAIRHSGGTPNLDKLLPHDEQRGRIESAVALVLSECWLAGRPWFAHARAADGASGSQAVPASAAAAEGRAIAAQLSDELTGALRYRLEESLSSITDVGEGAQDLAGAAYREWKGPRIEALAGDYAVRAFSSGAVAAGQGVLVRWVMDDDGQPCPDCDDNVLAGDQAAGELFPTGQAYPPVHAGCRCLLVAVEG